LQQATTTKQNKLSNCCLTSEVSISAVIYKPHISSYMLSVTVLT